MIDDRMHYKRAREQVADRLELWSTTFRAWQIGLSGWNVLTVNLAPSSQREEDDDGGDDDDNDDGDDDIFLILEKFERHVLLFQYYFPNSWEISNWLDSPRIFP